jgi:hypothetical protein
MASWHEVGRASARFLAQHIFRPKDGLKPALLLRLAGLAGGILIPARAAEPSFYDARVAPIFEQHCVGCHGEKKHKAELRLDSFEHLMKGSDTGAVVKAGDTKASELFRRITLPSEDDEVMPSDGKPHLSANEIKVIELWIAGGASREKTIADFPNAPAAPRAKAPIVPLAPDWHARAKEIAALEKELGLRLRPRSQIATDGLVLRTASAPRRCDDAALAKLKPVADLIVEAELARTKVTDVGLKSLAACTNLRAIDLTHTAVTSEGLVALSELKRLETINLTETAVDDRGVAKLKTLPALKRLWLFGTKASQESGTAEKVVAR